MTRQTGISIARSRYMGKIPRMRAPGWTMVGQDGGHSIAVGGKTLFLFSDTLLLCEEERVAKGHAAAPVPVPPNPETVFLANCAAISEAATLPGALSTLTYYSGADGLPREIVSATERERFAKLRFWPEHGVAIGGRVYFYYLGVQTTDASSAWGFRVVGVGLASIDPATGETVREHYHGHWILWRDEAQDLHFGVHVLSQDEFLYVFGSVRDSLDTQAILARVRPDRIGQPDAYEFLSASTPEWCGRPADAMRLGTVASDFSVSYNSYLGKYTLYFVDGFGKRLMMRTADHIWGPYGEPIALFRVPSQPGSELIYLGMEHSSFQGEGGRTVYVTYCEPHFSLASELTVTFAPTGRAAGGADAG